MDDLISRAALLRSLNEQAPKPTTDDLYTVNLCIINAPAVDAVPVVRCKDCKYYNFKRGWREWECDLTGYDMGENWYCANGERKMDGETNEPDRH